MADFASFELGDNVYNLADDLLPEMAYAMDYPLGETPNEEALRGFVGHIGPAKTLQDNIGLVQQRLNRHEDAVTIAADWTERSGTLKPLDRDFIANTNPSTASYDAAVITGGVGRWMSRRAKMLMVRDDITVGKVYLAVGNRTMRETEHDFVEQYANNKGRLPTEAEFAADYLATSLQVAGREVVFVPVDTEDGEAVFDGAFEQYPELLDGKVLSVGNAPSAMFTAGQLRHIARKVSPSFDNVGLNQLTVLGDPIEVAREGEKPTTHQNPFTALGQIARTALYLHLASQTADTPEAGTDHSGLSGS